MLSLLAALHGRFRDRLTLGRPDGVYPTIDIHHVTLAEEALAILPAIAAHFIQSGIDLSEIAGKFLRSACVRAGICPARPRRHRLSTVLFPRIRTKIELP